MRRTNYRPGLNQKQQKLDVAVLQRIGWGPTGRIGLELAHQYPYLYERFDLFPFFRSFSDATD